MRADAHAAFTEETHHLQLTLEQIHQWKEKLVEQAHSSQAEIDEILSNLADAKKPEDMTQAQQFEMTRVEAALTRRTVLSLAEKDPYFGRIDLSTLEYEFQHNVNFEHVGSKESKGGVKVHDQTPPTEVLYLGKLGVENEENGSQLIVDWRAPVADLYYAGIQGRTHFEGPYGPIEVELHLLRRILIESGRLKEISDQEEAAGIDDFLLSRLRENASTGMKDIISTIQKDQNEIIRLPFTQPLVVQGVAGSGKTSVALHRMSYLLYAKRKEIYPEDTLILTPSRLFFGYIASVMPDLDIRRCKQKTFAEIVLEQIEQKINLQTTAQWMIRYCNQTPNAIQPPLQKEAELLQAKGSLAAIAAIDRYFSFLVGVILPAEDLTTADGVVLAKHDDMKLRYDDLKHMPLDKRVKIMHRWLQVQSKRRSVKAKEEIHDYYERRLEIVRSRFPVHLQHMPNPKAIQLLQERDDAIKRLQEQVDMAVKQYRQQMPKQLSLLNLYQELMGNEENLSRFWPELSAELRNAMVYHHNRTVSHLDQEDLALLLRLKEHLYGLKDQYIHVVIDEAQDLNLAEFFMIRRLLGDTTSMTIVGDLAQGIYPQRGLTDWSSLMDDIIHDKQIVYREMKRSYRSSAEIIDLANTLLLQENTTAAEAVRQTGDLPVLHGFVAGNKAWQQKAAAVMTQIKIWQQHADLNTFAVLCKGSQNCQKLYHALQALLPGEVELITEETDQYQSKIVVLPVFLAKGLEFDACFVADAENTVYSNSKADRHLLYVALTRPLHRLAVYYSGSIADCLRDLPSSLYQV